MKRVWFGALLVAFAAVLCSARSTTTRSIVLELTLPGGAQPLLEITEGGLGTVTLPKEGTFGFVPALKEGERSTVIVDIFDLARTPHQKLGTVVAPVGAASVESNTKPQFGIRALRIITR
jgi:hypothetical protein